MAESIPPLFILSIYDCDLQRRNVDGALFRTITGDWISQNRMILREVGSDLGIEASAALNQFTIL